MNQELKEHLAKLARELGAHIRYEYTIDSGACLGGYESLSERYGIWANGFKTINFITIGQVMRLLPTDFIKRDE